MHHANALHSRRIQTLSRATVASLGAVVVAEILNMAAGVMNALRYAKFPGNVYTDNIEGSLQDVVGALALLALLAVQLVSAICFMCWFHKAYDLLDRVQPESRALATWWTTAGFLLPVISLFRPYMMMDEIWKKLGQAWDQSPQLVHGWKRPGAVTRQWWGLFVIAMLMTNVAYKLIDYANTAASAAVANWMSVLANGLTILAAIPAVLVVLRTTALYQPLLAAIPTPSNALATPPTLLASQASTWPQPVPIRHSVPPPAPPPNPSQR